MSLDCTRVRAGTGDERGSRWIAGKVKNGVVVPEDHDVLVEGATVSVVASDGGAAFTAPPEDEAALWPRRNVSLCCQLPVGVA